MTSSPRDHLAYQPLANPSYDVSLDGRDRYETDATHSKKGKHGGDVSVDIRPVGNRTPSPTPSEEAELKKTSVIDWKAMGSWRFWIRRDWLWYYVIGVILVVLFTLMTIFHKQIVKWLQPAANWMHDVPGGWLIPIAIFFVISFPPLFGHEILAILCGLVWGLWVGFAITCAGTFLGELGNFYAFKYCCSARGEKLERTDLSYACLARVVREGGFKIALIARLSAIPGHFTTAVFSTCGMTVWTFAIAAILSLPKQLITVYLGVALEQSETGKTSKSDTIVKYIVFFVTMIITFGAMWYIYHQMNKVKPAVIYARRKARQRKLGYDNSPYGNLNPSVLESATFDPTDSDDHLPSASKGSHKSGGSTDFAPQFQRWDAQGKAVGYAPDPLLYAPQPRKASQPIAPAPAAKVDAKGLRPLSLISHVESGAPLLPPPPPPIAPPATVTKGGPPQRRGTDSTIVTWDLGSTAGTEIYPLQTTRRGSSPRQQPQALAQGQGHQPQPQLPAQQYSDPFADSMITSGYLPPRSPPPGLLPPPPSVPQTVPALHASPQQQGGLPSGLEGGLQ